MRLVRVSIAGLCVCAVIAAVAVPAVVFSETRYAARIAAWLDDITDSPEVSATIQAHDLLRAGKTWEAADVLLETLHNLPDTPEAIDDLVTPLHLLAFDMCTLMPDDMLPKFLETLDPETYPIDELVESYFYVEYRVATANRPLPYLSQEELMARLESLSASPSPLVRACATTMQACVWDLGVDKYRAKAIEVMNEMAQVAPDSRVVREAFTDTAFRVLIPIYPGQQDVTIETKNSLLLSDARNAAMTQIINEDPVVQAVQDVAQRTGSLPRAGTDSLKALVEEALYIAQSDLPAQSRDWAVRLLSVALRRPDLNLACRDEIKAWLEETVDMALDDPEAMAGIEGIAAVRAMCALLGEAADAGRDDEAMAYVELLLENDHGLEPVDLSLYEFVRGEITVYAAHLGNKRDYCRSIAVQQMLIDAYPNSDLAKRAQDIIDNIGHLCE